MLHVTWALMMESGLVRGDARVKDLQGVRDAVWAAYRGESSHESEVSLGIALALAQVGREAPAGTSYESLLVRVAVTPIP